MRRFSGMACLGLSALALVLSGCGEEVKKNATEPGMESKGALNTKGKAASRPAPPAPPAIQPVKEVLFYCFKLRGPSRDPWASSFGLVWPQMQLKNAYDCLFLTNACRHIRLLIFPVK